MNLRETRRNKQTAHVLSKGVRDINKGNVSDSRLSRQRFEESGDVKSVSVRAVQAPSAGSIEAVAAAFFCKTRVAAKPVSQCLRQASCVGVVDNGYVDVKGDD